MAATSNAIVFKCGLFGQHDRRSSEIIILLCLDTLIAINRVWLKDHPETPLLYHSGVRYLTDDERDRRRGITEGTTEDFCSIPEILSWADKVGDCDDLASWRVAELRERGRIKCRPYIRWRDRGGFTLYHVLVQYADHNGRYHSGCRFEDPSLVLGMARKHGA